MRISVFMVVLVILVSSAVSAAAVRNPDSVFGVIAPWGGIKDAGIKWVRCGAGCTALDWGAVEKERGVFVWKDADSEVNNTIKDEGVDLLPILGYTPKWASSGPNGEAGYPPKDLKDWSDFVYSLVDRYKGKIKYWEVWNEEDIGFFNGTVEQYTDMLKSAYIAAKRADPNCKIVFGGTAGVNLPFVEAVYANGGKQYFDVMACHPYQWGDTFDDSWFSLQLRNLHALMSTHGDGHKEIWLTEFGWSTGDKAITNDIQARLLAQGFITSFTLRDAMVTKTFWFSVKDWGGPGYGLYADDGSRKPAFDAYAWVSGVMNGAEYVRSFPDKNLRCHLFRKDGKAMLAVWSADKDVHQMMLPSGFNWKTVQKLCGPVQTLNESRLSAGPEPLIIRSETKLAEVKSVRAKTPKNVYTLDVWYSPGVPAGTARPYIIRGRESALTVTLHNDSAKPAEVVLMGKLGAFRAASAEVKLEAGEVKPVALKFMLPEGYAEGLADLALTGTADGKPMVPTTMKVRVTGGPSVEFTANSTVETLYMAEDKGSGGAPSVRFNGTWTYKFDMTQAKGGKLDLNVGAHQANEWRVLLSSDQKTWTTALSGKSNRSWHSVDVTPYAGGTLYVKFEGNDQQLSELILTHKAL